MVVSESVSKLDGPSRSRNEKVNNFNSANTLKKHVVNRHKPNVKEKVVKSNNLINKIPTKLKLSTRELKEKKVLSNNHMSAKNILVTPNTDYFTMKNKKAVVQVNTSVTNPIHVINKITKTYSSR